MAEELSEASKTHDIDGAPATSVGERESLVTQVVESAQDEVAAFCAIQFWIVWAVVAITACSIVAFFINRDRLDPLVVLACCFFASASSEFLPFDMMTYSDRKVILIWKPIGIASGVITMVGLVVAVSADCHHWGFHLAWIVPVGLTIDWSVTRMAYAIWSPSYREKSAEQGSSVLQQQLTVLPTAIVVSLVAFTVFGAVFAARYLGTRSVGGELLVNGLGLPIAKVFMKNMVMALTVKSAAAQTQVYCLLGVYGNMPGAVLTTASTSWRSYLSCSFLGAFIEILIDSIQVHLAVTAGIGGIKDIVRIARGYGTTEKRSPEKTARSNSLVCDSAGDDVVDTECGDVAPSVDTVDSRSCQQSGFEHHPERELPGFVHEEIADDSPPTATLGAAGQKVVDELLPSVSHAQSDSFIGIVPGAPETAPPHGTSGGLQRSPHAQELHRRQERRLLLEERVDKFVALTAPAIAAVATSVSSEGAVVPWTVFLARAGINICLEVAMAVGKGLHFRRRYDVVPRRALEGKSSPCDLIVGAFWFLSMTGLCYLISLAFYVVSTA